MATISVTTLQDVIDPADGETSLREAIERANQTEGGDTIIFDPGVEGLIRLTEGELLITESLTLDGAGKITVTGDKNGDDITFGDGVTNVAASLVGADRLADNSRILNFGYTAGEFTLKGLTLTGGRTASYYDNGGSAILATNSNVELLIEQSSISGNSTAGSYSHGGAIHINGSRNAFKALTITDSTISRNATSGNSAYGGAIKTASAVEVTNSTISGNSTSGSRAKGGALYTTGQVTIKNSTITGNRTEGDIEGGAIYARAQVVVSNSIILGNKSGASKGDGIYESDDANDTDTLIEVSGANIIGSDASSFDVRTMTTGSGTARNASSGQVFAVTEVIAGVEAGVLADNGGPVPTIALKEAATNPALDATALSGTDARGLPRGVDLNFVENGGASDLGAFELQTRPGTAPVSIVRLTGDDDFHRATQRDDTVLGFGGDDTIIGFAGDDLLVGGVGADFITGSAGDDSLRGNAGADTLSGNSGSDHLVGGGGADVIRGGGGADVVTGGGGADRLNGGGGSDLLNGSGGKDVLAGRGGADTIFAGNGADAVNGGGGRDQLNGGRGADRILGGNGADTINGDNGADTIIGGNGDDVIAGGNNGDTLTGGAGSDVFQFASSGDSDLITDFRQGEDRIEILSGADAFADLSIVQIGEEILIEFSLTRIRVESDSVDLFDESDFIF